MSTCIACVLCTWQMLQVGNVTVARDGVQLLTFSDFCFRSSAPTQTATQRTATGTSSTSSTSSNSGETVSERQRRESDDVRYRLLPLERISLPWPAAVTLCFCVSFVCP